jgi:Tol biopolymer transport system component
MTRVRSLALFVSAAWCCAIACGDSGDDGTQSKGGSAGASGSSSSAGKGGSGGEAVSSGGATDTGGGSSSAGESMGGAQGGGPPAVGGTPGQTIPAVIFISQVATPASAGGAGGAPLTDDWEIWVMDPDGQNRRQVTENDVLESYPKLSADGTRIAFEREVAGEGRNLFVMDANGTNELDLTAGVTENERFPAWSPDGAFLLYSSRAYSPSFSQLFRVESDGATPGVPVFTEDYHSWYPSWVGTNVAYQSDRDGPTSEDWDIWLKDAQGSAPGTNLTNTDAIFEQAPAISPNEQRIVFFANADGDNDIFIMDIDGKNLTPLTQNAFDDTFPQWSPDGTKIIFMSDRAGGVDYNIWVMNSDGSEPEDLTPDLLDSGERYPFWGVIAAP